MNTSPDQLDDRNASTLKLDDLSLQAAIASYPEPLKEPVMWLGWFLRERCSRDLGTLAANARAIGIDADKTTWSKVLRGKWNRNKDNIELPSPIIALEKIVRYITRLRDQSRIDEQAGKVPFIETGTTKAISGFIDTKRIPDRVNKLGIIVGPTGSQKTAALKEYARRNNHGSCVWLEMPENGSMKEFIVTLAHKYGGSRADSYEGARRRVMNTLNASRTIIIDNAQAGYKEKHGSIQPIFNFLRRVGDETGCTVILSITPEFDARLTDAMLKGYFEQFEGRAGGRRGFLRLPDYAPEEDVLAIAQAFELKDAEKHLPFLVTISKERGRIRRLFEDLQEAKINAQKQKTALTIRHIKAAREEEEN